MSSNINKKRRFFIFSGCAAALTALNGCGYKPLYGQNSQTAQMDNALSRILVERIAERSGQMMRTALKRRLAPQGQSATDFKLEIQLTESIQTLALQQNAFETRANLKITASYTLRSASDGQVLTTGKPSAVASYNILTSDFATLAAQGDARENAINNLADLIKTRLAIYFNGPGATAGTSPQ